MFTKILVIVKSCKTLNFFLFQFSTILKFAHFVCFFSNIYFRFSVLKEFLSFANFCFAKLTKLSDVAFSSSANTNPRCSCGTVHLYILTSLGTMLCGIAP